VLIYLIYRQLISKNVTWINLVDVFVIEKNNLWFLAIAILLMPFNWFLESLKWKNLVNIIQLNYSFINAITAVLIGVFFGFITPNRIGEFGGRLFNIDKSKRIDALNLSFVGGLSQFVVTFFIGFTSFELSSFSIIKFHFIFIFPVILFIILYIYFNIKTIIKFLVSFKIFKNLAEKYIFTFEITKIALLETLLITIVRYCVYVIQYILILYFFDVELEFMFLFKIISIMILLQTILPTFALIDVGIRGNVLLFLLSNQVENQLVIVVSVLLVWILNLVIPAVIGYLIFLNQKMEANYEKSNFNIDNNI